MIKSKKADGLTYDLERAFAKIRENNIRLNPEKCVFRVPKGMLLGFIVSELGIEANPEKISAIEQMGPIQNIKGIQRLTGRLAALSSFISPFGERVLPLYKLLKKFKRFEWTPEAQTALNEVKRVLSNPPVLTPPAPGETLLLYIGATTQVVSAALTVEQTEEGHALKVARPVYYVSEVLFDSEVRYP